MITFVIATLLMWLRLVLAEGVSDDEQQCIYEFGASRTILALANQTLVDYAGVVLAPGSVLAVSFSGIHVPDGGANITGASLFVIPTFHASSSVTLEVAIPAGRINNGGSGDGAGRTSLQGDSHQIKEEGEDSLQVQVGGDSRNASDLESEGTVNGWSISEAQSTEGSLLWEPCRYYEVGNIRDGVQQVLSNDTLAADGSTHDVEIYLRHHSGQNAFIEGNNDTYANNVVLQIRGDCGWGRSLGSAPAPLDSTSTPASASAPMTHSYSSYTVNSAAEQGDSSGSSGATNAVIGFIQNGQRHPLCGGEYFDNCDLGPYGITDLGDGSCQQHLNTEGCHYDGGDCCSASCGWASSSDTPYICQGAELDPYFCNDPAYAIDLQGALQSQSSAATTTLPYNSGLGGVGSEVEVFAWLKKTIIMVVAGITAVAIMTMF